MKYIDLFAGTGAFSYVLNSKELECVYANDYTPSSKSIYNLNFNEKHFDTTDLNKVDVTKIPKHDVLCGGFPCQPFSIAGEKKGFNDHRSNVFWKIIEILKFHKPKIIILENVKNLTTHDNKNTFNTIKENLEKLGYKIKFNVLDTSIITDIPQHRERIYIIGFLTEEEFDKFNFKFNEKDNRKIVDFLEEKVSDKYYYSSTVKVFDTIINAVNRPVTENIVYQYRRYYVRENKSNCCPTLTANMGTGGHNVPIILDSVGIRKLTPRECFNLQGFPTSYKLPNLSDSALYSLAGNAISVPVLQLIADKLF